MEYACNRDCIYTKYLKNLIKHSASLAILTKDNYRKLTKPEGISIQIQDALVAESYVDGSRSFQLL